jgi:hypothetical protein
MSKIPKEIVDTLVQQMADEGRLIEAGWVALYHLAIPADAPEVQINEMRMAYMAGAQHLFSSIMGVLDPGEEPTDEDMRRIDLIHTELEMFREELELRYGPWKGSA